MQDTIERTVHIPTDITTVWKALTTAEGIAAWFGDSAEIDLRPGGEARFGWTEYGESVHAIVQDVEEPHRFSYRWTSSGSGRADEQPSTLVQFTLVEDGDGTSVTVIESGFLSLPDSAQVRAFEENSAGWKAELDDLVSHLSSP